MCILIFVGSNGETYYNTAALVSCVQNFPKNRGPVVGILKGFSGLSGAILTPIYALIHSPDQAAVVFMVAVGPAIVVIALMFIVRPVGGHRQIRSSDSFSFSIVYTVCLILAAYLMGVMLVQDLVSVSQTIVTIFSLILFILLLFPIAIPITLSFFRDSKSPEEALLLSPDKQESSNTQDTSQEKSKEVNLLPASERQERIAHLQVRLTQAAAEGGVRIKKRRPHRGEDFTMMEALIKADLWLIFISLLLGSGSGLTVIYNLGQMSESLGDYTYPRPAAMTVAQVFLAVGHFFFAMGWPGAMYIGTLLVGLGYGAHWAIVPATASELFGLKKFAALYNFLTLANPAGTLVFSRVIASSIYDSEAAKQAQGQNSMLRGTSLFPFLSAEEALKCKGTVCFFLTSMILTGLCVIAVILSSILVYRTRSVYANLYGDGRSRS